MVMYRENEKINEIVNRIMENGKPIQLALKASHVHSGSKLKHDLQHIEMDENQHGDSTQIVDNTNQKLQFVWIVESKKV
jgi:hypothetical protein